MCFCSVTKICLNIKFFCLDQKHSVHSYDTKLTQDSKFPCKISGKAGFLQAPAFELRLGLLITQALSFFYQSYWCTKESALEESMTEEVQVSSFNISYSCDIQLVSSLSLYWIKKLSPSSSCLIFDLISAESITDHSKNKNSYFQLISSLSF